MAPDAWFDRACDSVADARRVDWAAGESQAHDADARARVRHLQVVARLAHAHRSFAMPSPAETTTHAAGAVAAPGDPGTTQWGRYTLFERIGAGTFGTVYRAWDPELERNVAIKLLHTGNDVDDEARDRVLREGRAIAKVRHPNVVSVFGVEVNEGRVGLCMELVTGRTLDDILGDQGPMSAQEAAVIGQTVCSALSAVHAAGLVHRDVKARNVMREVGGRIVLMDFGTGHAFGDHTPGGRATAGTPIYMAPEALTGAAASVAADIYSTGVLLFRLVTGRYPVEGTTLGDVEQAHARGERNYVADFRPDLPLPFVRAVEQALDPHPVRRHKNAARLMVDLLAVSDAGVVPAAEPGPRPGTRDAFAPRAVRAGIAAFAALVTCLALGFLNSWAYTYWLGLDATFVHETPLTWMRWGLKSIIAPVILMIGVSLVALSVFEVMRFVRHVSSVADRGVTRTARACGHLLRLTGQPATTTLARLLVIGTLAFLAWVAFGAFPDLLASCLTPLDEATDATLRRLSPANEGEHMAYRQTLSLGILVMVVGWVGIARAAARQGERLPGLVVVAGVVSTALAVMLLNIPYRIFWQSQAEQVTFKGVTCFVVGERADALRLFCPGQQPRWAVTALSDPQLVRTGTFGSIFAAGTNTSR